MLANTIDSRDLPLYRKLELIRGELEKRFPDHRITLRSWRNKKDEGVWIEWEDGPSLIEMLQTGLRERYGLVFFRLPSCFVTYNRRYSLGALETTRTDSPYRSYDYTRLAETSFDPDGKPINGILAEAWFQREG